MSKAQSRESDTVQKAPRGLSNRCAKAHQTVPSLVSTCSDCHYIARYWGQSLSLFIHSQLNEMLERDCSMSRQTMSLWSFAYEQSCLKSLWEKPPTTPGRLLQVSN